MNNILPLNRALLWILLSTLMISGTALMAFLYYRHVKEMRVNDSKHRIVALIQHCDQKESLKTGFLNQLLGLSYDQPINLYQYNILQGEQRLNRCPLIKTAKIRKVPPNSLYVHYQVREPIAYLGDYRNTAMDDEGYLFPTRPFFSPKLLPVVYLGIEGKWGQNISDDDRFTLAMKLYKESDHFAKESMALKLIDVSDAFSESNGNRQIVIALASPEGKVYLLRLNTENYQDGLRNFRLLKGKLNQSAVIDLRLPHLAFIKG